MIKIVRLLLELENSYKSFSIKDSVKNTFNKYTIKDLENVLGMLCQLELYDFINDSKRFTMVNKLELQKLKELQANKQVVFGSYNEITLMLDNA
jgi:hypothetical protein